MKKDCKDRKRSRDLKRSGFPGIGTGSGQGNGIKGRQEW
jgi:hypothetical protein